MICKYNEKEHRAFVLVSLVFLTNFVLVAPSKLADFEPEILQSEANARHSKRSTNSNKSNSSTKDENKEKEQKQGTYKTKEEIEKPPKMDHPCNLTRTTVKISFPELKGEVFVNLLGYKEPNLIPLWRCKGVCGDVDSPIACTATKVKQKRVQMTVKTHLHGRDSKERLKELILDEHEACGCQCNDLSISRCAGTFNERTCECECEEAIFGAEKAMCETRSTTYWDKGTCQCRSKSVAPRETDQMIANCLDDFPMMAYTSGFDVIGYIFLGSCITMAVILTATTLYYRRKLKKLSETSQAKNNSNTTNPDRRDFKKKKKKREGWHHPNQNSRESNGKTIKTESSTSRSYESSGSSSHHHLQQQRNAAQHEAVPILYTNSIPNFEDDLSQNQEQYDQHGVRIENQVVIDF